MEGLEDTFIWAFTGMTGPKVTLPSGIWLPGHSGVPSSSGPSPHHPPCLCWCLSFFPTGSGGKNTIKPLNSGSDSRKHLEVLTNTVFFWFFLPAQISICHHHQYLRAHSALFPPNTK